jgi:hypothetical protein
MRMITMSSSAFSFSSLSHLSTLSKVADLVTS